MKIFFVHTDKSNKPAKELDTYSLAYDFKRSQFYMLMAAPGIQYAPPQFTPSLFEFYPNGVHLYFNDEALASDFFGWLQRVDADSTESFNRDN